MCSPSQATPSGFSLSPCPRACLGTYLSLALPFLCSCLSESLSISENIIQWDPPVPRPGDCSPPSVSECLSCPSSCLELIHAHLILVPRFLRDPGWLFTFLSTFLSLALCRFASVPTRLLKEITTPKEQQPAFPNLGIGHSPGQHSANALPHSVLRHS